MKCIQEGISSTKASGTTFFGVTWGCEGLSSVDAAVIFVFTSVVLGTGTYRGIVVTDTEENQLCPSWKQGRIFDSEL